MNDIISATSNSSLKSDVSKKRWNILHTLKQTHVQTLQTGGRGMLHCRWTSRAHCFEGSLCLPSSGSSSLKVLIHTDYSLGSPCYNISTGSTPIFIPIYVHNVNNWTDLTPEQLEWYPPWPLQLGSTEYISVPQLTCSPPKLFETCMAVAHMTGPSWVQAQASYAAELLSSHRRTYCHLQHKLLMRPCYSLGQGPNIHIVPVIV